MGHLNSFSASGGVNLNKNFPKIQMPGGLPGGDVEASISLVHYAPSPQTRQCLVSLHSSSGWMLSISWSIRNHTVSVYAKRDCGRFLTAYEKEKLSRSIYVTDNAGNRESINKWLCLSRHVGQSFFLQNLHLDPTTISFVSGRNTSLFEGHICIFLVSVIEGNEFQMRGSFPFSKKVNRTSACNEKLWNVSTFIGIA